MNAQIRELKFTGVGATNDCPSANETALKDVGEVGRCLTPTKHDEAQAVCLFQLTVKYLI